jgi:hypothetical protein
VKASAIATIANNKHLAVVVAHQLVSQLIKDAPFHIGCFEGLTPEPEMIKVVPQNLAMLGADSDGAAEFGDVARFKRMLCESLKLLLHTLVAAVAVVVPTLRSKSRQVGAASEDCAVVAAEDSIMATVKRFVVKRQWCRAVDVKFISEEQTTIHLMNFHFD